MPLTESFGPPLPDVPPPKEGRWIARPKRSRWALQIGAGGVFLSQLPNLVRTIVQPWFGAHGAAFAMVALVVLMALLFAYFGLRERRARRLRPEDQALVDGAFGDQYPAEMTIVASGKRLGSDRGVVWFADGLIGFSGGAASFVLAATDVERQQGQKKRDRRGRVLPPGALVLRNAPGEAYVIVAPLGNHTRPYFERLTAFCWRDERVEAERHWPPLVAYDEAPPLPVGTVNS